MERGGEGSQVGNLCSAACGKVVARNLEIAEAERAAARVKESASPAMEKETTRKHAEEEEQNGWRMGGKGMPKVREKQTEGRGTVKRKGKGMEGMARWSLSVGTRATK